MAGDTFLKPKSCKTLFLTTKAFKPLPFYFIIFFKNINLDLKMQYFDGSVIIKLSPTYELLRPNTTLCFIKQHLHISNYVVVDLLGKYIWENDGIFFLNTLLHILVSSFIRDFRVSNKKVVNCWKILSPHSR